MDGTPQELPKKREPAKSLRDVVIADSFDALDADIIRLFEDSIFPEDDRPAAEKRT
jgi:hypothetical protein